MFDDLLHYTFRYIDSQEIRDALGFCAQIRFQIGKMHEENILEMSATPP